MRGDSVEYLSLPFTHAIDFFRGKVALPTEAWDDLWQGMHSRAFVVAGATKADLLLDIRGAVDRAISTGTTLADFRKDFDTIVTRHGWDYTGDRNWRSAVIYDTNLSVAYAAGHHKAMMDPAVLAVRPYWRYLPSSAAHPREEHRQWYNLVIRYDDDFWKRHRPPNGWGCHCGIASVSVGELARLREEEAGGRYPISRHAPEPESYEYTNKKTGVMSDVPVGIDPGWDYNPGAAAWGRQQSRNAITEYNAMQSDTWEMLTDGNFATYDLPRVIPTTTTDTVLGELADNKQKAAFALSEAMGADEKIYSVNASGFRFDALVNAETLTEQMDLKGSPFLTLLPEAIEDPSEIWLRFEKNSRTDQVVIRQRTIKAIQLEGGETAVVIGDARNGMLESFEVMPVASGWPLDSKRVGKLVYRKKE